MPDGSDEAGREVLRLTGAEAPVIADRLVLGEVLEPGSVS
jgi:hypothetical protein